jgi:hypothetical protein
MQFVLFIHVIYFFLSRFTLLVHASYWSAFLSSSLSLFSLTPYSSILNLVFERQKFRKQSNSITFHRVVRMREVLAFTAPPSPLRSSAGRAVHGL